MNIKKFKEADLKGIAAIVIGALLLLLRGNVISIVLTIMGILALLSAFESWKRKQTNAAIVKVVIGVCILVFGWIFVELALYLIAAVIIMVGLKNLVEVKKFSSAHVSAEGKLLLYVKPALTILAGVILLFNQGGVIDWIFLVVGVLLIMSGVLEFFGKK